MHLESRFVSHIKHQDVPEAVGYMEVEDYSSRTANLSWTPPYDGNSPITVYNIIYKTYRWTRIKKNNIERMLKVYWKYVERTSTRSSWTSAGREQVYGSVSQAVLKGLRPNTLVSCTRASEDQLKMMMSCSTRSEWALKTPWVRASQVASRRSRLSQRRQKVLLINEHGNSWQNCSVITPKNCLCYQNQRNRQSDILSYL